MDSRFEWVAARDGAIPPRAIAGGVERDGRPLFIARAFFKGGLHPGKAAPHIQNGGFAMGWGGGEHNLNEYFVLCGNANAVQWVAAGKEADGVPLFVAKANFQNSQQLAWDSAAGSTMRGTTMC
ncbi:hypothetical protein DL89DRAFT_291591 [Linderina pennispora]|uniref:Uncharacterized protein n=1 Tax=Linderina pennispora TaxID=61395 RepID=A0A1Y1WGR0_9FUNG|nr:uncharacterized protein DL89DRAFT_291591 [Linderina pennispora]ORX72426.1 hypothetical protein DL89DRAFT_291591 [Linderina pennispora]